MIQRQTSWLSGRFPLDWYDLKYVLKASYVGESFEILIYERFGDILEFMIKSRCSPRAAIGRLSHQSTVGRELVNGCMRLIYAIYYMSSIRHILHLHNLGFFRWRLRWFWGSWCRRTPATWPPTWTATSARSGNSKEPDFVSSLLP